MFTLLRYAVWGFGRLVLPLRYRIRVHGLEALKDVKGPVLVLPNHPAYVDPLLVFHVLWRRLKLRPMVFSGNFDNLFFRFIKRLVNAHEVPALDTASTQARAQTERALAGVAEGMRHGENQVIWPAGHVQ